MIEVCPESVTLCPASTVLLSDEASTGVGRVASPIVKGDADTTQAHLTNCAACGSSLVKRLPKTEREY